MRGAEQLDPSVRNEYARVLRERFQGHTPEAQYIPQFWRLYALDRDHPVTEYDINSLNQLALQLWGTAPLQLS